MPVISLSRAFQREIFSFLDVVNRPVSDGVAVAVPADRQAGLFCLGCIPADVLQRHSDRHAAPPSFAANRQNSAQRSIAVEGVAPGLDVRGDFLDRGLDEPLARTRTRKVVVVGFLVFLFRGMKGGFFSFPSFTARKRGRDDACRNHFRSVALAADSLGDRRAARRTTYSLSATTSTSPRRTWVLRTRSAETACASSALRVRSSASATLRTGSGAER